MSPPWRTWRTVKPLEPGQSITLSNDVFANLVPGTGKLALSVTPTAALDVASLLAALDRYPLGCTEQIVSRALPLLYVNDMALDAKLAAEKKIVVIPTARLITWLPKNVLSDSERPLVENTQRANLKLLFESNVPLAIGSDNTRDSSFDEVMYLREREVFSDLDLLRRWVGTAALSIFPGRKIGKLEDGYEASFIALEADPLKDLANVKKIKYRFKQGSLLELPGPLD